MNNRDLWRIAITTCTPRQWEALTLRYIHDLTYTEIAARMNISERAASRHVQRALHQIHQHAKTKEVA